MSRPKAVGGQHMAGAARCMLIAAAALMAMAGLARAQLLSLPPGGPIALIGDEPSYLDLGLGSYSAFDHDGKFRTVDGRAEFRFGQKLFYFGPAAGIVANGYGGVDGFAGIYTDIRLGPFRLTPLTSISLYHHGDSHDKNLSGLIEFRSEVTLSYELPGGMRIGLVAAHMSNANIYRRNPGENDFMASLAFPLGF
ncbi:MAG: acyloxyacyl hydrolase [Stellaceae bacterium]